jgi:hypothetical protein
MIARIPIKRAAGNKKSRRKPAEPRRVDRSVAIANALDLPSGVILTATALKLPADLTLDDWKRVGIALAQVETRVQWWLGDWWHYGEHKYGERKALVEADRVLGYAYSTVANYGWVAGSVQCSLRNEHLSFNHHYAVATLKPEEQKEWLDRAAEFNWSVEYLRTELSRNQLKNESDEDRACKYAQQLIEQAQRPIDLIGGRLEVEWLELVPAGTMRDVTEALKKAAEAWNERYRVIQTVKYKPRPPIDPTLPKRHRSVSEQGERGYLFEYGDGRVVREAPADGKWNEVVGGVLQRSSDDDRPVYAEAAE